jgi:hypothetical protein
MVEQYKVIVGKLPKQQAASPINDCRDIGIIGLRGWSNTASVDRLPSEPMKVTLKTNKNDIF